MFQEPYTNQQLFHPERFALYGFCFSLYLLFIVLVTHTRDLAFQVNVGQSEAKVSNISLALSGCNA